jgi:hypothetical protein
MGWGKVFKYGLAAASGAAEGFAEVVQEEDKYRKETSKGIFAVAAKKAAKDADVRDATLAEIKEENEGVEALKVFKIDGKPVTEAQARAIYRTGKSLNIDPADIFAKYKIEGEGTITDVAPTVRTAFADDTAEALAEQNGGSWMFREGRAESLAEDVNMLLKAAKISTKTAIPSKQKVSGVSITPIDDTNVDYSNEYILDADGVPVTQVIAKRTTNNRTKVTTVTYLDKLSGKEYKVKEGEKISSSADAFKKDKPFADFGPLLVFNEAGDPEFLKDKTGQIVSGYLMKNGEIRLQKAGKIDTATYVPEDGQTVLVAGKDYAPSVAAGDLTAWGKMFKFPPVKEFYTSLPEMDTQAQGNDLLFARSQKRLDIHTKYGQSMYGIEGGFATMVTGLSKNAKGIGNIVLGLSGLDTSGMNQDEALDAKVQYLESSGNIGLLRDFVAQEEEIMSAGFIDKQAEIAMARVMDSAIATVTAYDLAKQTGDTRISNADFDAYISTVTGNNAEQTVNLIKNGLDDNLTIYRSKYRAVSKARDRIPEDPSLAGFQKSFDKALATVTPPSVYEAMFTTMFKPFEEKKEPKVISMTEFTPTLTDVDGTQQVSISITGQEQPVVLKNPRYLRLFDETVEEKEKEQIKKDIQDAINRILQARAGK